jgi:hypothetical protein
VRLSEPIQQQAEFVLTPFVVISQVAPPPSGGPTEGTDICETA